MSLATYRTRPIRVRREVDAIASATLRALVRTCITRHVEEATLAAVERVEDAERQVLAGITAAWKGGGK